jgi:outer membrane cobalamin receptor
MSVSNNLNKVSLIAFVAVSIIASQTAWSFARVIDRGQVKGSVSDPDGAKISRARVTLRDASGIVIHEAKTGAEGEFSMSGVAVGKYVIVAEATGFAQNQDLSIEVASGRTATIELRLDITALSDRLVVTATRTESPLSEVGGSVSVVSEQDLLRSNHQLVSESLRTLPGAHVVQSGGRGGFTSVSVRGGEFDYNKILIDGVPVNAAGGQFDFGQLTTENIDRIEVVRGPRSALFGSDAMTSVIQIATRRGSTSTPELELSTEGGSFDFFRSWARLSGAGRGFDYSGSYGFQTTDGRFQNSDYRNRSASANIGYSFSPDAQFRVTSRWNNSSLGAPGPTAFLFADPDERQKHRDLALAASFDFKTTSRWHQSVRGLFSEFDTFNFDPVAQDLTRAGVPPLPPGAFFPDFAFTFRTHQKRAGIHYQTIAALADSNVLTAGLDFEREAAILEDGFSRVSPDRRNIGLYVQHQSAWRERLFVTAGLRLEHNSADVPEDLRAALEALGSPSPTGDVGFGTEVNPKLAVAYLLRNPATDSGFGATRLRASFGTGIKEPTLDEAFSPSFFFLGNPLLDPERARSFDLGLSQELLDRRAAVELTFFDNRFRDLIVFRTDPVTFGPIRLPDGRLTNTINLDKASARGIEMAVIARPSSWLRVGGGYTFLRTRVERAGDSLNPEVGFSLLRRPRHSGSAEIVWVGERFDLSLEASFVGRRRDIDPVTFARLDISGRPIFNKGYAKVNFAGSYRFNRWMTAFTRVENLLNQDYQEILGFPAYRLNFSAGLRLRVGGDN